MKKLNNSTYEKGDFDDSARCQKDQKTQFWREKIYRDIEIEVLYWLVVEPTQLKKMFVKMGVFPR